MVTTTNRRTLLGAIAAVPATLAAIPVMAAPGISTDPVWRKLVDDFRAKYAAWMATISLEDDANAAFHEARASLPPEPSEPESANDDDILDKTLRELRDACRTPEHEAAWVDYKRDHAAWQTQHDALREQFVGPARTINEQTSAARIDAFDALTAYRVTNLRDLREKIEIIAKDYEECDIPPEYVADILADVQHLAGEVRA
jgi:hypothetical protein